MSKNLSLGKLTMLYVVGNLASKVIGFSLFFVYTFYISKENIGYYDLITTTIGWVIPIVSLQIYDAVLRWVISDQNGEQQDLIVTNSVAIFVAMLILFSVFYWAGGALIDFQFKTYIFCCIVLQSFYPIVQQFARGSGKNSVYVASGVMFSVIYTVVTMVLLIKYKMQLPGLFIANIISTFLMIVYIGLSVGFYKHFKLSLLNFSFAKSLMAFSTPLIPNTLSWWVIATIDRYIILYYLDASYNGLFAIAMKFPTILYMLSSLFGMAWQEKAIRAYNTEDRDFYYSTVFKKYFSMLFGSVIVLIAVTKPAIKFIVQANYYESWKLMPFLYVAVCFQALASFYGTGYISSKNTKGAFTTTIYGAVVTIVLNLLLIPRFGLIGSSISILLGYFTMWAVRVYQTKKYFNIELPVFNMALAGVTILVVSGITISESLPILIINVFLGLLVCIYMNRRLISEYFLKAKHMLSRNTSTKLS